MDSKPVLIRDGALLTSTGWVNPGYVVLKDGLISEIGHGVPPQSWQDVCEIFSVSGHAVLPGFVNGHTHFSQTFMRGLAGGRPLLPWLKQLIWPLQGVMSAEELKLASLLGLVENLRSGVTEVVDHHKVTRTEAHTDAVIAAATVVPARLAMASDTALRICPLKRRMKRLRLTELLFLLSNRRSTMRTVIGTSLRSVAIGSREPAGGGRGFPTSACRSPTHEDFLTRRYHSQSRRTCFSV